MRRMNQHQRHPLEMLSPRGQLATLCRPLRRLSSVHPVRLTPMVTFTLPPLNVVQPDEESLVILRPTPSLSNLPTRMPHRTATRVLTPWSRALKKRMTILSLGTLLLPAVTPERRHGGSLREEALVKLRDMIRTTSTPA